MMTNNKLKNQRGYIALIALLIVVSAGLSAGLAVSLSGLDEIQISFAQSEAVKARSAAYACLEDGLERLRNNWINYSDSLSIDDESCIINAVVTGSNATVIVTGKSGIYEQKIEITLDSTLNITFWEEE